MTDPSLPTIVTSNSVDPIVCGGNGTFDLTLTGVIDGAYSIDYSGGSFAGVNVVGGSATVTTTEGVFNDLQITINGCSSVLGVDETISDPVTHTLSVSNAIDPITCGGNGSFDVTFLGVVDGVYSIDYSGGSFAGVNVVGGVATISTTQGIYTVSYTHLTLPTKA